MFALWFEMNTDRQKEINQVMTEYSKQVYDLIKEYNNKMMTIQTICSKRLNISEKKVQQNLFIYYSNRVKIVLNEPIKEYVE